MQRGYNVDTYIYIYIYIELYSYNIYIYVLVYMMGLYIYIYKKKNKVGCLHLVEEPPPEKYARQLGPSYQMVLNNPKR